MTGQSLKQARREYERMLTAVFTLLIHCGVRQKTILEMAARALTSSIANARIFRDSGGGELETLGLVLDAWHRDRRYLTSRGSPKAVPLFGKGPSVEALIRAQSRQLDASALARRMQSLRLVAPHSGNKYRPASDAAIISSYDKTVLQHVARSFMSLLDTVEHNLGSTTKIPPLLERFAEVPNLPIDRVESFSKFSRAQGSAFVRIINDWLETRRVRTRMPDSRKTVRAGVRLHVYIAPNRPGARSYANHKRRTATARTP
jgi:hypothetical protein